MSLEELRRRKERALLSNSNPARPLLARNPIQAQMGANQHLAMQVNAPVNIDLTGLLENAVRMGQKQFLYTLRDEINRILKEVN